MPALDPTGFVLQRLHRFLTAEQVTYQREDPERIQRLLDQLTRARPRPEELAVLVLIALGVDYR